MEFATLGLVVVPALALLIYRLIYVSEGPEDEGDFGELSESEPESKVTVASARDTVPGRDAVPASVLSLASLLALGVLGFVLISILSKHDR